MIVLQGDRRGNSSTFVGTVPREYDRCLGPMIFSDFADDIARRATERQPMRLLEIAAGTGIVTRRLRHLLPAEAQLTATDLNEPMLDVARTKFKPDEQVTILAADAASLPFPDSSFDTVVCQFGLMFFADKQASYREVLRLLAPGGRYIFNVWDAHRHNQFGRIAQNVCVSFFPADPPLFFTVPFSCHQIDPVKEGLIDAGFININVTVVKLDKEITESLQFGRGLVLGNPFADQSLSRNRIDPDDVIAAMTRELRREFGADPGRMSMQSIVFSAEKPGQFKTS